MSELANQLLALLFGSVKPLSTKQLAEFTGSSVKAIENAVVELNKFLQTTSLCLVAQKSSYAIATRPNYATLIAKLPNTKSAQLSASALEVLALVAYNQPVSKATIDTIRGIQSDTTLGNLAAQGLIEESVQTIDGLPEAAWQTTTQFLVQFGLQSINQLPTVSLDEPAKTQ